MFQDDFLSNKDNAYLVTLVIASPLHVDEKRMWLTVLPFMKDDEKEELKTNLEKEIVDYKKLQEESFEILNQKIEKLFQPS